MARSIAVTFDYRCPFAYNGNAAVVAALRAGSDIDFRFTPFSLDQAHTEEGEAPVWDRSPSEWGTGTLALQYGLAVRDAFPERPVFFSRTDGNYPEELGFTNHIVNVGLARWSFRASMTSFRARTFPALLGPW